MSLTLDIVNTKLDESVINTKLDESVICLNLNSENYGPSEPYIYTEQELNVTVFK